VKAGRGFDLMNRKPKVPKKLALKISDFFRVGATVREVCKRFRVGTKVALAIRNGGIGSVDTSEVGIHSKRTGSGQTCTHSDQKVAMIAAARRSGMRLREISRRFGVSESYACQLVNGHLQREIPNE
jgi:transposase-like protein